jgi:hypothetical protein
MSDQFSLGSVIFTYGNRLGLMDKAIARFSGSWWTHVFIVVGPDEAVEAVFPRVRLFKLSDRIAELTKAQRSWTVTDMPLTIAQKFNVVKKARSYVGRWYNLWSVLVYTVTRSFTEDGEHFLTCTRLITASYLAAGVDLLPQDVIECEPNSSYSNFNTLEDGYATPDELMRYSLLNPVVRRRGLASDPVPCFDYPPPAQ